MTRTDGAARNGVRGPRYRVNRYDRFLGRVMVLSYILRQMPDEKPGDALYRVAESQAGYFTARQAQQSGVDRRTLSHHAQPGGRYERVHRGLYRLRQFPSSPHEHIVAAWIPFAGTSAVVSHESALEVYDLSDIIPGAVHITVPRDRRWEKPRAGVKLHTSSDPPGPEEIRRVNGFPVTSAERTIVDSLEAGSQPDQIQMAIQQALQRGLATPRRLYAVADGRPARVRKAIDAAIASGDL